MTKHHTTTGRVLENIVIIKYLKKKVLFIRNGLFKINLTIMEAFIMKEMDSTEIASTFVLEHSFYT